MRRCSIASSLWIFFIERGGGTFNYDRNDNITQLQRNGKTGGSFGMIGNLTYTYSGNRLTALNDAVSGSYEVDFVKRGSGGYTYYANGALKTDENEEITNIVYNTYLNLPEEITLSGGRWIKYTYDGEGKLLKTEYSTGEYWEYVDGSGGVPLVFKNGQPYQASIPDGRATYASGNWVKEFDYKDHLGNTRASFKEGSTGAELTAKTDFDPWGVRLNGTGAVNAFQNRWELQGKEKEMTFNLNRVNFGTRVYNPTIGRWDSIDPLADHPKQTGTSPYAFVNNNPLRYVDPTGMIWEDPKQAERLNKSINNRIASIDKSSEKIQAQIDKGGLSDKKLAKLENRLAENSQQVELLNQSLADVEAIGNATETYRLTGPSASDGTHGVVKGADGVIKIEGSNTGLHIHEIRHVGQSIEAGGVKFNKDGKLLNAATTLEGARNNEVNAYQTQYSFDGSYPARASSLKDINGATLMNIRTSDGKTVYEKLKDKKR